MSGWTPRAAIRLVAEIRSLALLEEEIGDLLDRSVSGAILSVGEPATHRYMLWRIWDAGLPLLLVVMLNPSTADHLANDNTIRGLIARARAMGCGGILVVNLFAVRATEPADMKRHADPVGEHNDMALRLALEEKHGMLLCAWGDHGRHMDREGTVSCLIRESGSPPYALKLCASGAPGHPLYIAQEQRPFAWDGISRSSD